jgi:hypothetical protein
VIQPKRYSLVASYYCSDAKMEAFEDGEFVRHADYAALQAENARLRKAGDALSYALQTCKYSAEEIAHYSDAWTEAKK